MRYAYYPGCSAAGTGRAFDESLVAVVDALGAGLDEIRDWNCCGASAAHSVDEVRAAALGARNLALAEAMAPGSEPVDLVTPCAGCFRALLAAQGTLSDRPRAAEKIDTALASISLRYERRARVRRVLDILINEIGLERIQAAVTRPLQGLRVACYYGCLLVQPTATFDDQRDPTSMDRLMTAIGAEPIDWPMKTRCCGGSCYGADPFSGPTPQGPLTLSHAILSEAKRRGADVVATACPLCQFNLEAFQEPMTKAFGTELDLTVGYVTQIPCLAYAELRRVPRRDAPSRRAHTTDGWASFPPRGTRRPRYRPRGHGANDRSARRGRAAAAAID